MTVAFVTAWQRAQLAEVAWLRGDGSPGCAVVVPLQLDGLPAIALPYGSATLAAELADAREVSWCLGVPEVTRGADPAVLAARVAVAEDLDAAAGGPILDQLIAKHPPDRRRLDCPLLRREHAWYVPRLVVTTISASQPRPVATGDGIACVGGDRLTVVAAQHLDVDAATAEVDARDGPAVVLSHGADVPDLERPWHRRWVGRVVAGRFTADDRDEVAPRADPLGLWARLRTERRLERACRAGLRAAGHR